MLGKQEVLSKILAGDISINYAFDPTATNPNPIEADQTIVDPKSPMSHATRVFDSFFFGDRPGITMGPIVLSHTYRRKRGRALYKGHPGCFDLRETNGKISLTPGETITFQSIEQICVGPNIAAIVLPRLSLATSGVIVAASYIDPYWDGILQLHLTNQSKTSFDLRFGERLAICRFYQVSGPPAPESERKRFAQVTG